MKPVVLAERGQPVEGAAFAEPTFRIPALAITPQQKVLAAWDVRADWRDLPGPFDLVLRASDDLGRSWGPIRSLRSHGDAGFGDASFIVGGDAVHCWYVSSTGRSFFDAETGPNGEGLRLWLATSRDDGATWLHRDLTESLKPADVTGMFASSGNGIRLREGEHAGRLIQPFVLRTADGAHYAAMAYSDDDAESWELGERIGPDCDENKVVELPGGRVLLHARATPRRRSAVSHDGGVTFSEPVPHEQLVDPACNGGLSRWGERVVCTLLDDPAERRRLALRWSADGGATWSDAIAIDEGAAAYSVAMELPDGDLGVAWESGDYDAIMFTKISRSEVGWDGEPVTLQPLPGRPGSAAPPEVAT